MVVLRCTRRLLDRLGARRVDVTPASTTLLGGWSANVVRKHRVDWIVCLNDRTFVAVMMRAAPFATFSARFADAAAEVLLALELDPALVETERAAMREVVVGKTNDRSVVGTLTEWCRLAEAYEGSERDISLQLSRTPSLVHPLTFPERAVRAAFAGVLPSNDTR